MQKMVTTLLITSLALCSVTVNADEHDEPKGNPEVMGFVEWVVMEDTDVRLKARMDTGAKTSSLHAVNIEEFDNNGERWVRFQLPLGDHEDQPSEGELEHEEVILEFERPVFRTVLIKRKSAPSQRRYVVMMKFCIAGSTHKTQFSLTDRGKFSYPVLLGRRFMADDNVLINSEETFTADLDCEYSTLEELAEEPNAKVIE
ncbi:MAG TPA: ATP-dependent zinc protease [Marinobacter sp.]|jgi:hypothetical protein|nr:ATP-dependent zinc protease [Marinobacter sp.]